MTLSGRNCPDVIVGLKAAPEQSVVAPADVENVKFRLLATLTVTTLLTSVPQLVATSW